MRGDSRLCRARDLYGFPYDVRAIEESLVLRFLLLPLHRTSQAVLVVGDDRRMQMAGLASVADGGAKFFMGIHSTDPSMNLLSAAEMHPKVS